MLANPLLSCLIDTTSVQVQQPDDEGVPLFSETWLYLVGVSAPSARQACPRTPCTVLPWSPVFIFIFMFMLKYVCGVVWDVTRQQERRESGLGLIDIREEMSLCTACVST